MYKENRLEALTILRFLQELFMPYADYWMYQVMMEHYRHGDESFGLFFDKGQALRAAEHVEEFYRDPGCYVEQRDKECGPAGYAWVEKLPAFTTFEDWTRYENLKKQQQK